MRRMNAWTKLALLGGMLCGTGEVLMSPTMDGLAGAGAALLFGAIFFAGSAWLWRGSAGGAVVFGIFAALELAFMPMYPRNGAFDWITQGSFGVIALIALVGSVGVLAKRWRQRAVSVKAAA